MEACRGQVMEYKSILSETSINGGRDYERNFPSRSLPNTPLVTPWDHTGMVTYFLSYAIQRNTSFYKYRVWVIACPEYDGSEGDGEVETIVVSFSHSVILYTYIWGNLVVISRIFLGHPLVERLCFAITHTTLSISFGVG